MPTARSLPGDLTWNLSSPNHCTNDAVSAIQALLFDGRISENVALRASSVTPGGLSKKNGQVTGRASKVQKAPEIHKDARKALSDQERSKVATEIVNLVLETLSTANSSTDAPLDYQIQTTALKASVSTHGPTKGRSVQTGRERICLQEKSPNKRRTGVKDGKPRAQHSETIKGVGLSALADCAGLAFRYLQQHSRLSQKQNVNASSSFQLEKGILAFIGRLLGLGLTKKALTEIQFLKSCMRCLFPECATSSALGDEKSLPSVSPADEESHLLLIQGHEALTPALAKIVFDFQTMAVRVASNTTDSSHLANMLPYLNTLHPRSPVKCLQYCDSDQMTTQLKSFSQLLWQTASKLPSSDTSSTNAPGCIALQLRTCALQTRVMLTKACDYQIDVVSDVLSPFHRCLMNFADQSKRTPLARYHISRASIDTLLRSLPETYDRSSSTEYIELHLGRLATEASLIEQSTYHAERALTKHSSLLTSAKKCALTIRIANGRITSFNSQKKNVLRATDALCKGANLIEGGVLGDSEDFEDMLRAVLELRKTTLNLFNTSGTKLALELENAMHRFLYISINVLYQLFCFPSDHNASNSRDDLLENKRALIIHATKSIIESSFFSLRRQQISEPLEWNQLSFILQRCSMVLDMISAEIPKPDISPILAAAESTTYRLKISDFYWLFAIRTDNLSQQCSESQLVSLRKACECVELIDTSSKLRTMLPLKMYKLSISLQESGKVEEAAKTLFDVVKLVTDAGVLSEAIVKARSMPEIHACNGEDHNLWRITMKALRKLLELRSEHQRQHGTETLFYDDEKHSAEQRGHLLECQLMMLLEISGEPKLSGAKEIKRDIGQRLLKLYDQDCFPIRRCRAIILLLYSASMLEQNAPDCWILESAKIAIDQGILDSKNLAQDSHLYPCQSTWLTLLKLCLSAHSSSHFTDSLDTAALVWSANETPKSLVETKTLSIEIDIWICQLEFAADCSEMLGFEKQRLFALLLLYHIRSKFNKEATQDVANCSLRISLQSLRLGHISMAKSFMEKARHWAGGKAASMWWKLRITLVEFQSSMAVGDDKNRHVPFTTSRWRCLTNFIQRDMLLKTQPTDSELRREQFMQICQKTLRRQSRRCCPDRRYYRSVW